MEPDLIDDYVADVRASLSWRRDCDVIAHEIDGHLRDTVERLVAGGATRIDAANQAILRFGDARLIADLFSRTTSGRLAIPTRVTRLAGAAGVLASVTWLAVIALAISTGIPQRAHAWEVPSRFAWGITLTSAIALTALTVGGALLRAGRARPRRSLAVGGGLAGVVAIAVMGGWSVSYAILLLCSAFAVTLLGHAEYAGAPIRPLGGLVVWLPGAAAIRWASTAAADGAHALATQALIPAIVVACALVSVWALATTGARLSAEAPARRA